MIPKKHEDVYSRLIGCCFWSKRDSFLTAGLAALAIRWTDIANAICSWHAAPDAATSAE